MRGGSVKVEVEKISEFLWEIPRSGEMLVPGRIYADDDSMAFLRKESATNQWDALSQVRNVACLPGITGASMAMADIHPGYGFPIGGVAAFDPGEGVVSIAGVGFDINCGVRSMVIDLAKERIELNRERVAEELFNSVPAGMGSTGAFRLSVSEIDRLLTEGASFSLERGYGVDEDLEYVEEGGAVIGADPAAVSPRAKERQLKQVGTLGSGNHYLEVQYVDEIFDEAAASAFGLVQDGVVVSIHTGSRALGHQIGTDYQSVLRKASQRYSIPLPESELIAAPIQSPEGKRYISAVRAGINCAFANRQAISGLVRDAFKRLFRLSDREIRTLYEVGHNNLKMETHDTPEGRRNLLVHRKGATRAFAAGREEVPERYRGVGQPVLVGGTMGTSSYILVGTEQGMSDTFGSAIHGAGRVKSRKKALRDYRGEDVISDLKSSGILIRTRSRKGAAEEAPGAYKDVERVVSIMEGAGVNRRVARLRPMICIKG
jgi:tRNA-splicing ligase RtcB